MEDTPEKNFQDLIKKTGLGKKRLEREKPYSRRIPQEQINPGTVAVDMSYPACRRSARSWSDEVLLQEISGLGEGENDFIRALKDEARERHLEF